jgi:hypothetical protein
MNFDKASIRLLMACALIVAFGSLSAEESAEEATSNPEHIYPSADDLDGSEIESARDRYLNERGWVLGIHQNNPSGGFVGWGSATIAVAPEDRNYGNARIAAVDAAVAEAVGQFALSRGTNAALARVREIVQDPNALEELQQPNQQQFITAVADRLRDLTAAQLDNALRELGVPPGKHQELEFVQKVQLAMDSVQTELVRSAREYFQGIRLMHTFEEEGAVGALVIYSPNLQAMARRILSGDMEAIGSGNSSDALDQLNGSLKDDQLIFMHGTRMLRDADGNPVLVAFGQASPPVTRADSRQALNMAVSAAQRRANLRADGALAEFLDSYVEVDDQDLNGVAVETIGELYSDGRQGQSEGATFYAALNSAIRQRSQIQLTGITTVRTWRANHPDTGHLHIGAVKMWSPTTQAAFSGRPFIESAEGALAEEEGDETGVETRSSPEFGEEDW